METKYGLPAMTPRMAGNWRPNCGDSGSFIARFAYANKNNNVRQEKAYNGFIHMKPPIYLDAASTNPVHPEVLEAMVAICRDHELGNPHARTHSYGSRAAARLQQASEEVASCISAQPEEVIFTSGGTESNNLAILGLADHLLAAGKRHVITTEIEHPAVLEPVSRLQELGFEVEAVPPDPSGCVPLERLQSLLRDDTGLVSVMAVNNEIGTIQPVVELSACLADHDAYFHVDAAQAFGRFEWMSSLQADLISISGHKVGAIPGSGALIARRRGYVRCPLRSIVLGGGQQRGYRSGTCSLPLAVSLATACRLAHESIPANQKYAKAWRHEFSEQHASLGAQVVGEPSLVSPWICSFYYPDESSEVTIMKHKTSYALSNGAACSSEQVVQSHVYRALKLEQSARGLVRASVPLFAPEISHASQ